jgi:hypothetical protein
VAWRGEAWLAVKSLVGDPGRDGGWLAKGAGDLDKPAKGGVVEPVS